MYVTFRLNFHYFNYFKRDARVHIQVQGAVFSRTHLELADMVLI